MNEDFKQHFLSSLEKGMTQDELLRTFSIDIVNFKLIIQSLLKEGITIQRNCDIEGNIHYKLKNRMKFLLPVDYETKKARVAIISDLHIGHIDSNIEYIHNVYNYAKKNGIHIILIAGDYIDGITNKEERTFLNKQIETLIQKFPYDSSIMNYFIGGNHEDNIYHRFGIDVNQTISNERIDFINLGYGMGRVKLGNYTVALYHPLNFPDYGFDKGYVKKDSIQFKGHSHQHIIRFNEKDNRPIVSVPCLSQVKVAYSRNDTGFLDVTFTLGGQTPISADMKHINLEGNSIITEKHLNLYNAVKKKRLTDKK